MLHIVLVEPEIPQNAGNIARTCAATGCVLHMVRPLGFEVSDKYLKRAGLDYWHLVDVKYYDSFAEVREEAARENAAATFYFFTTKAKRTHSEAAYKDGDYLVFGTHRGDAPSTGLRQLYPPATALRPGTGCADAGAGRSQADPGPGTGPAPCG